MKIKFLGAAQTVTGSCHFLKTEDTAFMVDCGLFQGGKNIKEYNYKDFKINPSQLDFLIVTHAHIDHSGLIPKLVKHGFTGPIYCTRPTAELLKVMLPDSAHIQETEVERKNRKGSRADLPPLEPIYTMDDAFTALELLVAVNYDELLSPAPDVQIRFRDAGHILGSAIVETWINESGKEVKIVFSGDLGRSGQPLIKDPTIIEGADYVVLESTYGDRLHKQKTDRKENLRRVIRETMIKGGNLIIPAFAVERTQDLIYDLYHLEKEGELKGIDIYIDSPLAIAATEIFQKSVAYFDQDTTDILHQGDHPLVLENLKFSHTKEDSMALNEKLGNNIIISASGMCDAGRIKHHLKHNLWRQQSTILFVGYQAQGSLGRRILEGEKLVRIHGEEIAVKADIRTIGAYSAHADQIDLLTWLRNFKQPPKQVFLVHGEPQAQEVLANIIERELGIPTVIPAWLDEAVLVPRTDALPIVSTPTLAAGTHMDKILAVESAYLSFREELNRKVNEELAEQNYDKLSEILSNLKQTLSL